MTLTTGPHVRVIKGNNEELEYNHGCFHRAWKATGKPDSSKHHKLIITYWFSKVTFLPAAKKSVPMHMSSYCSKKIASV